MVFLKKMTEFVTVHPGSFDGEKCSCIFFCRQSTLIKLLNIYLIVLKRKLEGCQNMAYNGDSHSKDFSWLHIIFARKMGITCRKRTTLMYRRKDFVSYMQHLIQQICRDSAAVCGGSVGRVRGQDLL